MIDTLLTRTPRDKMAPEWRGAYDTMHKLTGDATFVEVFAQRSDLLDLVMNKFYMTFFFAGKVAERYKQLARLKLSLLHGCLTCNKQNVPGALAAGFTQGQINALIAGDAGPFTDAERAVIRYAEQIALTNAAGKMTPELLRDLKAHFDEGQILELGTVMAIISGMGKLSFVLNVVEKEDYCPFASAAA